MHDVARGPGGEVQVTFNAHILETGTQSYRLATSKTDSRACQQKAYRQRGGRAPGTTGAQRRRQQQTPPADRQPIPRRQNP